MTQPTGMNLAIALMVLMNLPPEVLKPLGNPEEYARSNKEKPSVASNGNSVR